MSKKKEPKKIESISEKEFKLSSARKWYIKTDDSLTVGEFMQAMDEGRLFAEIEKEN